MTLVRLEPAVPRSRVKHSTTEPLCYRVPQCQVSALGPYAHIAEYCDHPDAENMEPF